MLTRGDWYIRNVINFTAHVCECAPYSIFSCIINHGHNNRPKIIERYKAAIRVELSELRSSGKAENPSSFHMHVLNHLAVEGTWNAKCESRNTDLSHLNTRKALSRSVWASGANGRQIQWMSMMAGPLSRCSTLRRATTMRIYAAHYIIFTHAHKHTHTDVHIYPCVCVWMCSICLQNINLATFIAHTHGLCWLYPHCW